MTDVQWAGVLIHASIGIIMIAFGMHQILKPETWTAYLPPWFERVLPVPVTNFMQTHGVGNLGLGFCFALGFLPQIFDWVTLVWWLSILPFAFYSDWAVGLRDMGIIAAIAALAVLGHP